MSGKVKKTLLSGSVHSNSYRVSESGGLTGWKYTLFVSTLVGSVGLALWPILIDPVLHINKYKKVHEQIEKELEIARAQPGGLKKFESPWKRDV